jgi:NAD(P)H-hydrate epimerase
VVHHGDALTRVSRDASLAEAVVSGALDRLPPRLAALCRYALKLTRAPEAMERADVEALRAHGLDDRAIVDANQVVSYFNYVNRVADGLGVELEARWSAQQRRPRSYGLRAPDLPVVAASSLPWLSVAQMREVDRLMVEDFGIALEQMMENAGRSLAVLARRLLGGDARAGRVLVIAGSGGNGGGGMVAARQLAVAGANVEVRLTVPAERLAPVPGRQHAILRAIDVPVDFRPEEQLPDAALVIDAALGYSQRGAPTGEVARLISALPEAPMLALDVPSGLELETGLLHRPHVRAAATLTLALPKRALREGDAGDVVGDLYLADISVPRAVYLRLGLEYESPFARGPIVCIESG